jgi:hypothetical protein
MWLYLERTEEYQEDSLFPVLNLIPGYSEYGSVVVTSRREYQLKNIARCFTNVQFICTEM